MSTVGVAVSSQSASVEDAPADGDATCQPSSALGKLPIEVWARIVGMLHFGASGGVYRALCRASRRFHALVGHPLIWRAWLQTLVEQREPHMRPIERRSLGTPFGVPYNFALYERLVLSSMGALDPQQASSRRGGRGMTGIDADDDLRHLLGVVSMDDTHSRCADSDDCGEASSVAAGRVTVRVPPTPPSFSWTWQHAFRHYFCTVATLCCCVCRAHMKGSNTPFSYFTEPDVFADLWCSDPQCLEKGGYDKMSDSEKNEIFLRHVPFADASVCIVCVRTHFCPSTEASRRLGTLPAARFRFYKMSRWTCCVRWLVEEAEAERSKKRSRDLPPPPPLIAESEAGDGPNPQPVVVRGVVVSGASAHNAATVPQQPARKLGNPFLAAVLPSRAAEFLPEPERAPQEPPALASYQPSDEAVRREDVGDNDTLEGTPLSAPRKVVAPGGAVSLLRGSLRRRAGPLNSPSCGAPQHEQETAPVDVLGLLSWPGHLLVTPKPSRPSPKRRH